MNATFEQDARANATVRAFVTASGDRAQVAARVDGKVLAACERMADDLGVPAPARQPQRDQSRASASCAAVGSRMDGILHEGGSAQLRANYTPPQCQVASQSEAACKAQCRAVGSAQGTAANAEAHCNDSCKAHADLTAQCTAAHVVVQSGAQTGEMPKLVATLERNLPVLLSAEIAYGQRIAGDVDALARAGAELPSAFGQLSSRAGACLAAAGNATVSAQASLRVSVQASAGVTARANATPGNG